MNVISALFTIALVVAIPLVIYIEPIKTYRKLKTPPCRTCSSHWRNDVLRELIRGARWCHYEPKE